MVARWLAGRDRRLHAHKLLERAATTRAPEHKPKQGAKNLAAIERIDRQNVEDQQTDIDIKNSVNQSPQVGDCRIPAQQEAHAPDAHDDWGEHYVHQRPSSDAP